MELESELEKMTKGEAFLAVTLNDHMGGPR